MGEENGTRISRPICRSCICGAFRVAESDHRGKDFVPVARQSNTIPMRYVSTLYRTARQSAFTFHRLSFAEAGKRLIKQICAQHIATVLLQGIRAEGCGCVLSRFEMFGRIQQPCQRLWKVSYNQGPAQPTRIPTARK